MQWFNAANRRLVSSRRQIALQGVREGILLLPNNEYRLVLRVSTVNFELMSEAERDVLIDSYQSFLNALHVPLQILIRTRELDTQSYIDHFSSQLSHESEAQRLEQITAYCEFVSRLARSSQLLHRSLYIVIPLKDSEASFESIRENIQLRADIVSKRLLQMGIHTSKLDNREVLSLFYSFYAPSRSKRQPLTAATAARVEVPSWDA